MLLTVCTIRQLSQAHALGQSFLRHHPARPFLIGLADNPDNLPPSWASPHPLLTLADVGLTTPEIARRAEQYTPTEFVASCKPAFVRAALERAGDQNLLYADPSAFVYAPLDTLFDTLDTHSAWLSPHWLSAPADGLFPDEKYVQSVGLYSGGLLGFSAKHPQTAALLAWWEARTAHRAHLDFCAGQCLDQRWLMHLPTLFGDVEILKNPGVQVAVWNLPHRRLSRTQTGWQVAHESETTPLLTADFRGLTRPDEGLFRAQNRLQVRTRPDVGALLTEYRAACLPHQNPALSQTPPAHGQRPEPVVRRGWRQTAFQRLNQLSHWIATVPVKPLHR